MSIWRVAGMAVLTAVVQLGAPQAVARTLEESVAAALSYRPDLERQGALLSAADAAVEAALADYLPQIDAQASAGWRVRAGEVEELLDAPTPDPEEEGGLLAKAGAALAAAEAETESDAGAGSGTRERFEAESDWRYGAGLEVRQLVFDGFGTLARIAAARAGRDGRLASLREVAELAALEAVQAHLDVLRAGSLVEIAEANVAAHRRLAGRVRQLEQGGQVTGADGAQAAARLAIAEADFAERLGDLAEAVALYVSRVGAAPDALALPGLPQGRPADEDSAVAAALAGHPSLAAADAEAAAGLAGVQGAEALWWPQLDLVARASADRSIEVLGGRTLQAEALAEATWNLYRGGGDSALLRQAEAELEATRLDRAERRRSVEEEVRVAYRNLLAAEAVALPLQRHAEAARQVLGAYGQQFDIGRRSLLDLLDAQGELTAARLRATDAQYRLLLAHYELAYALGDLTATLGLAAPVP